MARTCLTCRHANRAEIDRALLDGEPFRNIAERVSLSPTALFRHRTHIESTLVEARASTEEADGDNLARKLTELSERARRLADAAEKGGDLRTALAGVRELARLLEIEGRVAGQLRDQPVINIDVATVFKLDGLDRRGADDLIEERLGGDVGWDAFIAGLLKRFPWTSKEGPPEPPDWMQRWYVAHYLWKGRQRHDGDRR
jgi:hypothetical protein